MEAVFEQTISKKIYREISRGGKSYYLRAQFGRSGEPLLLEVRNECGDLVYFKDYRGVEDLEIDKFDYLA